MYNNSPSVRTDGRATSTTVLDLKRSLFGDLQLTQGRMAQPLDNYQIGTCMVIWLQELIGRACDKDFVFSVLPKQLDIGIVNHSGDHGNTTLQIYLIRLPDEM